MPRDIRTYFGGGSTPKPSNTSSTKSKKRRVISSDEEDETSQATVKRAKKMVRADTHSISSDSERESVKEVMIVSPAAMFARPIKRVETPKINKHTASKEAKIHTDKDFEDTLSQLDTSEIEVVYVKEDMNKAGTELKNKTSKKHIEQDTKTHKAEKEKKDTISSNEKNIEEVTKTHKAEKAKKDTISSNEKNIEEDTKTHKAEKAKKDSTSSNEDKVANVHKSPKEQTKKVKTPVKKGKTTTYELNIESKVPKKKGSPVKEPDVYEEMAQKKKQHLAAYQQYLQRGGARNPGSKEIPTGKDFCLGGLSFLITGVLDSLEREQAEELIKRYGGRIVRSVSKKTDFVVVGDEPGPSKMEKARSYNIKLISEDDLLELICTRPAGVSSEPKAKSIKPAKKVPQSSIETIDLSPSPPKASKSFKEDTEAKPKNKSPVKKRIEFETTETIIKEKAKVSPVRSPAKKESMEEQTLTKEKLKSSPIESEINTKSGDVKTPALVEKYRPKTIKQILGQHGDNSNAKKLYNWLRNWQKNHSSKAKHPKPNPWTKNSDGSFFKAALLSGPPGVGKTTTVQLVCKELNFDLVEFNASDTRSKKLLKEEVSEMLSNTSIKDYFSVQQSKPSPNHVLLMDEVDGMAGNEDRGGLQELIALIKSTEVPIVCICNDRNNLKMRTLSHYTFDLRFSKPKLEQIRGAMKSICFKEQINIATADLDRLIDSTNLDIRQVINHLSLYAGIPFKPEETEKKNITKDIRLGPWDVVKKVFSSEEQKRMSIHDKSNLFFQDYNIGSLFVQENYLSVDPSAPKSELLERVAETAESLALGDMVEKSIRTNNAWELLPLQACYSSVIPGTLMAGHFVGQINFPAWLGRNSKKNKFSRMLQELSNHTRRRIGAGKDLMNLDYLNYLRDAVVRPLVTQGRDGIDTSIGVMNHYNLLREDLDSLLEVSLWPGQSDPFQKLDSQVKAAFTRSYNKNSTAIPNEIPTGKKKKAVVAYEGLDEEEEEEDSEDEDNINIDKMIKAKKPGARKKTASKRGRGRGRGK